MLRKSVSGRQAVGHESMQLITRVTGCCESVDTVAHLLLRLHHGVVQDREPVPHVPQGEEGTPAMAHLGDASVLRLPSPGSLVVAFCARSASPR